MEKRVEFAPAPHNPSPPSASASAPGHNPAQAAVRALLFDADGDDRALEPAQIDGTRVGERQLLWVDVEDDDAGGADALLPDLVQRLGLGEDALAILRERGSTTRLQNVGDWFLAQVVAVEHEGQLRFGGRVLAIVCGANFVVSLHRGPLALIDQLRDRERADTRIGTLSAESFAASLLDWVVDSYLRAVSDFEAAVDRLEVAVLSSRVHQECLPELAQLRRGASRLRRMLSPHRQVFGSLARPDFRPSEDGVADRHFRALEAHFERAMDAVENTRELVVGSFELFTTRSAERTNDTMRVLTFVTVLLGSLAVVVGALGMNFKAPLFDSGQRGFWGAIVAMLVIAVVGTGLARWRRWI
jgi:Mg2+ and Co2+ transporter CorA